MNTTITPEISILSGIIFFFTTLGFILYFFIIILESDFKKMRPKWAYGATMFSLAFSWVSALILIVLISSKQSDAHKVLNTIFMTISAVLFVLIGCLLKRTLTKENTKRDLGLLITVMIFALFVCLPYIWI